jgi:hypothetical protein
MAITPVLSSTPITIRWQEGERIREMQSDWRPETESDKIWFETCRLIWKGRAKAEARKAAETMVRRAQ